MGRFYAVLVGRTPGVYTTWDECSKQVNGFSGAKYKKFASESDAMAYIGRPMVVSSSDLGRIFAANPYRRHFNKQWFVDNGST
jgi:hypothetical protein